MLTAIVPTPDFVNGSSRQELYADDVQMLAKEVREFIMFNGYGASDVGSRFNVYRDGVEIGYLTYNGKFVEGENKPATHGGDAVILEETL